MAKKNKKKNSLPQVQEVQTVETVESNESMTQKVNQSSVFEEDSLLARVIGLGLVALGVVFVILAIVVVYLSRQAPELDREVQVPTVVVEKTDIKDESVQVRGKAPKDEKVAIYLNGQQQDLLAEVDGDGNYSYNLEVTKEGRNEIQAATVVGFPNKRRSDLSQKIIVNADFTAPSTNAELNYDPVVTNGVLNMTGKIDPNTKITVESGDEKYSAQSDAEGNFALNDIKVEAEEESFDIVLEDKAGNRRELARKVDVTYPAYAEHANGDLNGDGVTTGVNGTSTQIPEASGELTEALQTVFGNNLMSMFALIAIGVFLVNSGVVALKLSSRR